MPRNSIVISDKSSTEKVKHGSSNKPLDPLARLFHDISLDNVKDEATPESPTPTKTNKRPRLVRFSTVTIREHNLIPGDNPACTFGIPVSIGWECLATTTVPLDTFDPEESGDDDKTASETGSGSHHRSFMEMRIPAGVRDQLLRQAGYSRKELVELCRPVNIARAQRKRTNETLNLASIQETLQRASKGLRKCVLQQKEQRRQEAYLKQWRSPPKSWIDRSSHSTVSTSNSFQSCSSKVDETVVKGISPIQRMASLDDSHTSISTATIELDASSCSILPAETV